MEDDPVEVLPTPPPTHRLYTTRRQKAVATIGLAALLALVAGGIWLIGRTTGDELDPRPSHLDCLRSRNKIAVPKQGTRTPRRRPSPPPDASSEPVLSRLPGSLVRIDARTGRILARLAILSPKLLASDGRSVWVLSDDEPGDKLFRIDADSNAVAESFNADVSAAGGEAVTEDPRLTSWPWPGEALGSASTGFLLYRFTPGANAGEAPPALTDRFGWPVAAGGSRLWSESVREAGVSA